MSQVELHLFKATSPAKADVLLAIQCWSPASRIALTLYLRRQRHAGLHDQNAYAKASSEDQDMPASSIPLHDRLDWQVNDLAKRCCYKVPGIARAPTGPTRVM